MDPTPADRDGEHARGLRGADVERRVADVDGLVGRPGQLPDRKQDRVRLGLVALRVLEADDDVECLPEGGKALERQADGAVPLRRDDSKLAALRLQAGE